MPLKPLPVLAGARTVGPADLVRLFHRAQLQRARALAREMALDGGTWLCNPDLQPLADANCVLDAAVDPGGDVAEWVARVDALTVENPVRGWTVNPSLPPDRTAPLTDHLARAGWEPRSLDVLHLGRLRTRADLRPAVGLTVIPARAAYGPFRRLMDDRFADHVRAEAAVLALDDPHVDALLALRGGVPVAAVALLGDGEVGTVTDLYVSPTERGWGTGRLLLDRALEASGRSGHKHVLAGVEPGATRLFTAVGFEAVGQWVQYVRRADGQTSVPPMARVVAVPT